MAQETAIIIGAGPAGLTAAYELLDRTDKKPIVYEMTGDIGGLSKTVNHNGNRIDIGGHRFFSKSDRVMKWWLDFLPLQGAPSIDDILFNRDVPLSNKKEAPDPEKTDIVMLVRNRLSRILFLRKFFDYPVTLNFNTLKNLGIKQIIKIALSYFKIRIFPIKEEKNLEDFFTNRFGKELYCLFFKDYTEKVWGVPCSKISPEWGGQRVRGLSVTKAILHAVRNVVLKDSSLARKDTETSLIEQFFYPKLGPGQMWETVAKAIQEKGGEIYLHHKAVGLKMDGQLITEIKVKDMLTGKVETRRGDYLFSSMPVKDLIQSIEVNIPKNVLEIAKRLEYRDFITVGLLLKELKVKNQTREKTINDIIPDNWIYIQENDVKLGRIQIFNNWSPYMVNNRDTIWIGLEYFCSEGDKLWEKSDEDLAEFAIDELATIDIIDNKEVLDFVVIRVPKTYPAYFRAYKQFSEIRDFTDNIANLFLVGRNGMHRYNNMDHSMMTAMLSVDNIIENIKTKGNIWEVNIEEQYHEEP